MLLIISERADKMTTLVIEYLVATGKPFIRLDYEDLVEDVQLEIGTSNDRIMLNHKIDLGIMESVWHRRARLDLLPPETSHSPLAESLREDELKVNCYLEKALAEKTRLIGSYIKERENNKMTDLRAAREAGLMIPETILTNNKQSLLAFAHKHAQVITKKYSASFDYTSDRFSLRSPGTKLLTEAYIDQLPEHFALSLFQQYIEKQVELRIFFFEDQFYAMAIFSQGDCQTQIDYRNYNQKRPNRNVPFRIEETLLQRLKQFNTLQGYTSGSFDIIMTAGGQYYFLELNPSGQFHWLSENCNYHIEKKIASCL